MMQSRARTGCSGGVERCRERHDKRNDIEMMAMGCVEGVSQSWITLGSQGPKSGILRATKHLAQQCHDRRAPAALAESAAFCAWSTSCASCASRAISAWFRASFSFGSSCEE
jgi:hypothetical protein